MQPCDFCGTQCDTPTEYAIDGARVAVQATTLGGEVVKAVIPVPGVWRACRSCTQMVEAGNGSGLLDRGHHLALGHVSALVALGPLSRRQFLRDHRKGLALLHLQFWAGYTENEDDESSAA